MTRSSGSRFTLCAASIVMLAALSCSSEPLGAPGSDASVASGAQSSRPTSIAGPRSYPVVTPSELLQATETTADLSTVAEAPALGIGTRAVHVSSSEILWITDDRSHQRSKIVAWAPGSVPRVLFDLERPAQLLAVSSTHFAWLEQVGDAASMTERLYAARRDNLERTLIDDLSHYAGLATYSEIVLDGSALIWTVPEIRQGVWHGRILRRDLETGQTDTLDEADGALFSWPAAARGALAYEVLDQRAGSTYRVRYRGAVGVFEVPGPASEPGIGDGYLLFKRGQRYDNGTINSFRIEGHAMVDLGPGEAPHADSDGYLAVWSNAGSFGGYVSRPMSRCVAPVLSTRTIDDESDTGPAAIQGNRLAWVHASSEQGSRAERVRTGLIHLQSC